MLKLERQEYIINKINAEKKIISRDLSIELNVSEDTIRRDLKELENDGKLRRVHSGALQVGPPVTSIEHRIHTNTSLKSSLASAAVNFIKPNSVVIIDSSSTNLMITKVLPFDFQCTIITNSPDIATQLIHHENIEIILLGGTIYKQSMVALGHETISALDNIRADLYIHGLYNVSVQDGLSVPTRAEAQVKQKMIDVSNEVLSLVISDKLETVSTHLYGKITDLNYLIVDEASPKIVDEYKSLGLKVIPLKKLEG